MTYDSYKKCGLFIQRKTQIKSITVLPNIEQIEHHGVTSSKQFNPVIPLPVNLLVLLASSLSSSPVLIAYACATN